MLRLSKLSDYAVVVLARLSTGGTVQTSPGIAAATGIPEPTVAKVLKALAGGRLVASQRGARGGYRLLRSLSAIPIVDVISVIEGPVTITSCVDGNQTGCDVMDHCPMRGRWDLVNSAIHRALSAITLADMQAASPALQPDEVLPEPPLPTAALTGLSPGLSWDNPAAVSVPLPNRII